MIPITEIRIAFAEGPEVLAYASVCFAEVFVVHGMRIVCHRDGHLFVAMPSRRTPGGTYQDHAHPIISEFREVLETLVLDEYTSRLRGGGAAARTSSRSPLTRGGA